MSDETNPESKPELSSEQPASTWKQDVFNVPNQISFARLILSFVVFALISFKFYWAALILFVIAAGTDWVDGWYARKYNLVTQIGRNLDSFCDKILICGMYILLAIEMNPRFEWWAKIAGWMAVVVVARELLVTVIRSAIEAKGGDFSAKIWGKVKMWLQCIAVVACLLSLAIAKSSDNFSPEIPLELFWVMVISVWLSVASTLHSGWLYVKAAKDRLA